MATKACKDCVAEGVTTVRKLVEGSGGRCMTHHRARRKIVRKRNHGSRMLAVYKITEDEYDAILESQGGKCFVCQKATGAARALAVDHDHALERDGEITRESIRAVCCGPCNRDVLGRLGPQALLRAIIVLTQFPAQRILRHEDDLG